MINNSFQNQKILVIDDNVQIHMDFKKILNDSVDEEFAQMSEALFEQAPTSKQSTPYFEVDFASQGEKGYHLVQEALASERPYALAFIDIRMPPGWNGVETARKILDIDPDIEIVFCTAYSDFDLDEMHHIIEQKNDFLIIKKPFEVVEIKQAAISLCKKWNMNQKLQMKLNEIQDQLLLADKLSSLGQLAAGVAHEINNPVGYINSNLNSLKQYTQGLLDLIEAYEAAEPLLPKDDSHCAHIESIKKAIDLGFVKEDVLSLIKESNEGIVRVRKIIQDLKDFSRSSEKEWSWYNLNLGIDSTLNIVSNELKYKANIVKKYDHIPPIEAVGSQINQVILNLLINAVQAIEGSGTITLETRREGEFVRLKVTDTGCGIDAKVQHQIFDPFFTTKPVGQGTGLGLALSYGIIQSHGGCISVESKQGQGSSFTIELPIRQITQAEHTSVQQGG